MEAPQVFSRVVTVSPLEPRGWLDQFAASCKASPVGLHAASPPTQAPAPSTSPEASQWWREFCKQNVVSGFHLRFREVRIAFQSFPAGGLGQP